MWPVGYVKCSRDLFSVCSSVKFQLLWMWVILYISWRQIHEDRNRSNNEHSHVNQSLGASGGRGGKVLQRNLITLHSMRPQIQSEMRNIRFISISEAPVSSCNSQRGFTNDQSILPILLFTASISWSPNGQEARTLKMANKAQMVKKGQTAPNEAQSGQNCLKRVKMA